MLGLYLIGLFFIVAVLVAAFFIKNETKLNTIVGLLVAIAVAFIFTIAFPCILQAFGLYL